MAVGRSRNSISSFTSFDPVNDGWGGSHWSEVELGLELGPEKGHLFALFIVCFAVYRLLQLSERLVRRLKRASLVQK